MTVHNQRNQPRVRHPFRARLAKADKLHSVEGMATNIGQGGAFIETKDWSSFEIKDQAVLTVFLSPDFSGHDEPIGLLGPAEVMWIDQENEGVGVKFLKAFKQFEWVHGIEVPGDLRYKKIAHYISSYAGVPLRTFTEAHPHGFFIEKTQSILDKDVIFQFSTMSEDDEEVLEQIKKGRVPADLLEARVIEIGKRKTETLSDQITIGRSPHNDIVLYNKMLSKSHAYVQLTSPGADCFLVDVGSKNGTLLNENRLDPHHEYKLADEDLISLGPEIQLVYFSSELFHRFITNLRSSG